MIHWIVKVYEGCVWPFFEGLFVCFIFHSSSKWKGHLIEWKHIWLSSTWFFVDDIVA